MYRKLIHLTILLLAQICALSVSAQFGKVGINTTAPAAMLHVKDSSVVFTGINPLSGAPGAPPISGAGTRMMWYADKAAFRTGNVSGSGSTYWNKENIGFNSVAMGLNTLADNYSSTALGYGTKAMGAYSTAMGSLTVASGTYSTAIGSITVASGNTSTAMGDGTTASGNTSTAMGYHTIASGTFSTAIGGNTKAGGTYSTAIGLATNASGEYSTSMGDSTHARSYLSTVIGRYNDTTNMSSMNSWVGMDPIFAIGNGTVNNARRNAFTVLKNSRTGINTSMPKAMLHVADSSVVFTGFNTLPNSPTDPPVMGAGARFMWYPDKAALRAGQVLSTQWDKSNIGTWSVAFGFNVKASNWEAVAMGDGCVASGVGSVAMGIRNTSEGDGTNSWGAFNLAQGDLSTAMGYQNIAEGILSTAIGGNENEPFDYVSRADSYDSFVMGRYNKTDVTHNRSTWVSTDPLFVIGNGSSDASRHNAFTVLKNGRTGINTHDPGAMLHILKNGNSNGTFNSSATLILESNQTSYIQFSQTNTTSCGILAGNESTTSRSSILFQADSSMIFRTGGSSTRLAISKTGTIGIGTTSPEFPLHVVNNVSGPGGFDNGVVIENTNSTTGEASILFANHGTNGSGNNYWIAGMNETRNFSLAYGNSFTGSNTKFFMDSLGNTGIGTVTPTYLLEVDGTAGKPGGGSWSNSSDIRLKKDIQPYTDGLEKVLQINPVTYHYNKLSGYKQEPEYVGVIAQQLKEIAPYMVSVSDKETDDGVNDYLQVDNSAMTYMLINAVKEQQKTIEELKQTILLQQIQIDAILKIPGDQVKNEANE